jgi:hypothetical protein
VLVRHLAGLRVPQPRVVRHTMHVVGSRARAQGLSSANAPAWSTAWLQDVTKPEHK